MKREKTNYNYNFIKSSDGNKNFKEVLGTGVAEDTQSYSYYSRVLGRPFDTVNELKQAEEAYYAEIKAKEDKAATKKADAKKVEDAFKNLNAARKAYKEKLTALTETYTEDLKILKKAFENDKVAVHNTLATAEEEYSSALKAFTDKYPEGYHITLKDGDFETTISSQSTTDNKTYPVNTIGEILDLLFNF